MEEIIETYKYRDFIEYVAKNTPMYNNSRNFPVNYDCKETFDEAINNARYGYKIQGDIQKIITSMALLENVKTKCFNMAENGLCIDMGAFLNGEPECFIAESWEYKPKKVVKILVNFSYAIRSSSKVIYNRGAGIISLIQMLKKQGYLVKIHLYDATIDDIHKYKLFIKMPTNPLDMQSLTYALCSTGFQKRLWTAWYENVLNEPYPCYNALVSCLDEVAISKDIIHFKGLHKENCSYANMQTTKQYMLDLFNEFLKLNNDTKEGSL